VYMLLGRLHHPLVQPDGEVVEGSSDSDYSAAPCSPPTSMAHQMNV